MLVGRLISRKVYPRQVIFPIIHSGWRFLKDLQINDVGPYKFSFTFASVEKKERILLQEPWNFKGSFMVLCQYPNETVDEVELSSVAFWVHIHGLPLGGFKRENAFILGTKLGKVMMIYKVCPNKSYLRVKVKILTLKSSFEYNQ